MKASDVACAVRARLFDLDKVLIPNDDFIFEFVNSALCDHHQIRPELYIKPKTVKLKQGTVQDQACCGIISKVDMLTSEDGTIEYSPLIPTSAAASSLFATRCASKTFGGKSVPTSASVDIDMPTIFTVRPAVLKGQELWARVFCSSQPNLITDENSELDFTCGNYEDVITFTAAKVLMSIPGSVEDNARGTQMLNGYYTTNGTHRKIQASMQRRGS